MLSPTAAPCALFAMGVTLGLRPLTRVPAEIFYIVPAKLLLHPILVGLALLLVGGFDPLWVEAAGADGRPADGGQRLCHRRASISSGSREPRRPSSSRPVSSVVTVSGLIYLLHAGILPTALREARREKRGRASRSVRPISSSARAGPEPFAHQQLRSGGPRPAPATRRRAEAARAAGRSEASD